MNKTQRLEARIRELEYSLKYQRELTAKLRAAKDYQAKKRLQAEGRLQAHFCDH